MNLDELIIVWFCLIDGVLPLAVGNKRLRTSGPKPPLADSEVVTMEVICMYLGLNQDTKPSDYFQHHWSHFLPALARLHCTAFVRQAANLWKVKERLCCLIRDERLHDDPTVVIVDSFPMPICQFARAYRCRRFRGEASYGKDTLSRQTFHGFRLHARLCWPGVLTHIERIPANIHEGEVALDLMPGTADLLLEDRNYWLPRLKATLRQTGIRGLLRFGLPSTLPPGSWSPVLVWVQYQIDSVFGRLVNRCQAKRVWARYGWHLCNRLVRMVRIAYFGHPVQSRTRSTAAPVGVARR